jgi:hypothetical protein
MSVSVIDLEFWPQPVPMVRTIALSLALPTDATLGIEAPSFVPIIGHVGCWVDPPDPTPGLVTKVFRWPQMAVPLLTIPQDPATRRGAWERKFADKLNDIGSGSMSLLIGSHEADVIDHGDIVRHYYTAPDASIVDYCLWAGVVTRLTWHTIPAANQAVPSVEVTCSGIAHAFARAVVLPALGYNRVPVETDRSFGWQSPTFPDEEWPYAAAIAAVADGVGWWKDANGDPLPLGWPATSAAQWIGPDSATWDFAPPGDCYYRSHFTAPSGTTRLGIRFTADDTGRCFFDGAQVVENDFARQAWAEVEAGPGDHVLAIWSQNAPIPAGDPGGDHGDPTGVAYEVWTIANGNPETCIAQSGDTPTRIVAYPSSPPSMTIGEIIRQVVGEWQGRGWLTGWVLDFSDDVDSGGQVWADRPEITTKVGTAGDVFLWHEIAGTWADLRCLPGDRVLQAFNAGTMGAHDAFDLHAATDPDDPMSGTLTELSHDQVESKGNQILAQSQAGWTLEGVPHWGEEPAVFPLGLGSYRVPSMVSAVCADELTRYARSREQITAGVVPWIIGTFEVGDTGSVPDHRGTPADQRAVSLTWSDAEAHSVSLAVELKDALFAATERHEEWLKKQANGTVDGTSRVAQPLDTSLPGPTCCAPAVPEAPT